MGNVYYQAKVGLFCFFHFIYTCYFIRVRPLETARDNLIEAMNQIFYLLASFSLIYLKNEDQWSMTSETIYLVILMTPSILVNLIMLVFFISKCFTRKKKPRTKPKQRIEMNLPRLSELEKDPEPGFNNRPNEVRNFRLIIFNSQV